MEKSTNKTIKSILKSFAIMVISILLYILLMKVLINIFVISLESKNAKGIGIGTRIININIVDNKIFCEETINFEVNKNNKIYYEFIKDKKYIDNQKIDLATIQSGLKKGCIYLEESQVERLKDTNNNIKVKLTYELDTDYITRYSNIDILPCYLNLINVDYINNLIINLNTSYEISNLMVNDATIKKDGNKYTINMSNLEENIINMLFSIDTELNNIVETKYIDKKVLNEREEYGFINERIGILINCAIISLIMFVISLIINKRTRVNNYRRETFDLVSPILAEAIIDREIGLKELIMTTIMELNIRGNIRILNNDTIELISLNNLETYEQYIVDLLFENNRLTFSDINKIFSKSNQETLRFAEKINKIKELILDKIISMKLISKSLTILNKVIGLISILIIINIPQLCFKNIDIISKVCFAISFFVSVYYIKKNINKTTIQEQAIKDNDPKKDRKSLLIMIITMIFFEIGTLIYIVKNHKTFLIISILTIILNIYIVYKSQAIVLTKRGKHQQTELLKLKKYINDYSLIKDRDLESVVIWDEYLAYATAFGIPNKVTDTIYEEWYNLNLNLQVIEKILQ